LSPLSQHLQEIGDFHRRRKTLSSDMAQYKHVHNQPVRIFIADDQPLILDAVKRLLSSDDRFQVVGEAIDGIQAVEESVSLHPDVFVLDVSMPKMSGFEAAKRIRTEQPHAAVVILSTHADQQFISAAKAAGAQGYVEKTKSAEKLIKAIESASNGDEFFIA
jgi:DNA-binding NarL/FixJ family response regulator